MLCCGRTCTRRTHECIIHPLQHVHLRGAYLCMLACSGTWSKGRAYVPCTSTAAAAVVHYSTGAGARGWMHVHRATPRVGPSLHPGMPMALPVGLPVVLWWLCIHSAREWCTVSIHPQHVHLVVTCYHRSLLCCAPPVVCIPRSTNSRCSTQCNML